MSEQSLPNGVPPQLRNLKDGFSANPKASSTPPFAMNGLSSLHSSRDSSPSSRLSHIPSSQLPPGRSAAARAQLPSTKSPVSELTNQVSHISVSNQSSLNASPIFTSTPNDTQNLLKRDINSGPNSAFTSPISSRQEANLPPQDLTLKHPQNQTESYFRNPPNQNFKTEQFLSQAAPSSTPGFVPQAGQNVKQQYGNFSNATAHFNPANAGPPQKSNLPHVQQNGQKVTPTPLNPNNAVNNGLIGQPTVNSQFRSLPPQNFGNSTIQQTQTSLKPNNPPLNGPTMNSPVKNNATFRPNFNLNPMSSGPPRNNGPPTSSGPSSAQPPAYQNFNTQPKPLETAAQFSNGNNQSMPPTSRPPYQGAPPPVNSVPKSSLHHNRYPTSPPLTQQQNTFHNVPLSGPANPTQQSSYNHVNNQSNFPPMPPKGGDFQNRNVVQQGFNKLWGVEQVDLLQNSNVLPQEAIEPPVVKLGNDGLEMANCSPDIFRSTITRIPESNNLLQKSRLPLGILIHPFRDLIQLPVIQCSVIVRCRSCRTYINPFVSFVDSKRWKCNLCYRINDLPDEFLYDPISKTYGDPTRRPEIKSSTIEYIAPAEYMLRPPQPAIYLFLLDISRLAVESGYLQVFCAVLQEELSNLPGDSRTQVGFIAYDSNLHFYALGEGLNQPHEMLVLDVDDVFLPCPDNLLVNLKDRRELIEDLLSQLPTKYDTNYDSNSALGAALQAAYKLMSSTGGRVTVFQAALPNFGPGALTARENVSQRTATEITNLNPANDFYKRLALECSGQQIAVDLFVVNSQYVDMATISGISRFSGGCIHHIPLFNASRTIQSENLERSFRRYLTRKIGFEAVLRVRCTRGLSIHTFHGNFFVRSTDLLSLPNVNPDSAYGMQVSIEENLSDVQYVCFQAALLYTSSKGERRIRVHTLCLPVVSTVHDVINSADEQCIVGLLSKMAVDRSMESSLSDAREAFINVAIDILTCYKLSLNMGTDLQGLLAPGCLKLLPLYISALLKSTAFRTGTSTRLDDRVKSMLDMKTKPLDRLIQSIYPDFYPIHKLEECPSIINSEEEQIHIPPRLQLSARFLDSHGAFLMDTGDHIFIYVGSGVSATFLNDALAVPNYNSLPEQVYDLPELQTLTSQNLRAFVKFLNDDKPYQATLQVIKDNSPNRGVFLERLVEDRVENALSYHEFLQHIKSQVK